MKNIFAILILLLSFDVNANGDLFAIDPINEWTYSIAYNVFTYHHAADEYTDERTGKVKEINNDNNFIGVRVNFNENFGAFVAKGESSVNEPSEIVGIEISQNDKQWELGSDFGFASGYKPIVSLGTVPFVNPFLRYNKPLSEHSKVAVKGGIMNFMAENIFLEYTHKF